MSGTLDTNGKEILVVTGEASGDRYAARVVEELRNIASGLRFRGIGGPRLAEVSDTLDLRFDGKTALGLAELSSSIGFWARAFLTLASRTLRRPPAAALLVDLPDFNLPLGRILSARGIPVVWYISPQVWAWRPGRVKSVGKVSKRIALAFSFEEKIYRDAGISHAGFVGHPLLDFEQPSRAEARVQLGLSSEQKVAAILPGSRPHELRSHLPTLVEAAGILHAQHGLEILLPVAPGLHAEELAAPRSGMPSFLKLMHGPDAAALVLAASDAALVCTGTATLQAALADAPFAALYKAHPLTYRVARRLVRVPWLAMPNILLDRPVVPELIQDRFTTAACVETCLNLLDPETAKRQKSAFREVRNSLGAPGAAQKVATMVLEVMR